MTTFFIKSLGCKVSQYDGERLAEKLRSHGFILSEKNPDLFIVNGCSVTGRASQKAHQLIRSIKRNKPETKIILAGCESRRVLKSCEEIPQLDWNLPHNDDESVESMIKALGLKTADSKMQRLPVSGMTRAYLKIQDGCSQFCTYCITSRLRGPEWSRDIDDAAAEAVSLVNEGHKELVLTGIHIGHFKPSLIPLLEKLEKIEGLKRVRLSSIESLETTNELIDFVADSKKCCHHFHLPLQSGCDKILKAMHRPYLTKDFKTVTDTIRAKMPDAAITTDLIVGFPGETEEDFQQTLDFLKEIKFSRIHIFKYSQREGTPAAVMPNQVRNEIKAERSEKVKKIWQKYSEEFHQRFVGKTIEVLWETYKDGMMSGFSREYVPCIMKTDNDSLKGLITKVTGVQATYEDLLTIPAK